MDRYFAPVEPSPETSKPPPRPRWKRTSVELDGRFESTYRRDNYGLLVQSYSEVAVFPHFYHFLEEPCQTHVNRVSNPMALYQHYRFENGVSALDFDNKGMFIASVTKTGCLTIHNFESLYCMSNGRSNLLEDEQKHVLHVLPCHQLDAVRWNPANEDEVACTSLISDELVIFDVAASSEPSQVLILRPTIRIHGCDKYKGLSDFMFHTNSDSCRVVASDTHGSVHVWDKRTDVLPCLELATNSPTTINSIEVHPENQVIYGADEHGFVHIWDLRGGRTSTAFVSNKEPHYRPLRSINLASRLESIEPLKAQSDIVAKEIHSIVKDPTCAHRLAFHLDDGRSGVLDTISEKVTHVHCPPPAWLNDSDLRTSSPYMRRPSWISTTGIYAVGSSSKDGLYLLDFCPDPRSPSHVDYREDARSSSVRQNRLVPSSEAITACAVHPSNSTIVAGTMNASLLLISQKQQSWKGEDECVTQDARDLRNEVVDPEGYVI